MRKLWMRRALAACLTLMCVSLVLAAVSSGMGWPTARMVATSAGLAGLAALLQLDVAGLFERLGKVYGDEQEFPFGPPSHVSRDLFAIDNPDQPLRSTVRRTFYTDTRTGLWLGAASIVLGTIAAWL